MPKPYGKRSERIPFTLTGVQGRNLKLGVEQRADSSGPVTLPHCLPRGRQVKLPWKVSQDIMKSFHYEIWKLFFQIIQEDLFCLKTKANSNFQFYNIFSNIFLHNLYNNVGNKNNDVRTSLKNCLFSINEKAFCSAQLNNPYSFIVELWDSVSDSEARQRRGNFKGKMIWRNVWAWKFSLCTYRSKLCMWSHLSALSTLFIYFSLWKAKDRVAQRKMKKINSWELLHYVWR